MHNYQKHTALKTRNAPGLMGGGTTCKKFFQRTCNVPGVGGAFGTPEREDSSGLVTNSCIRLVTHLVSISWREPSAPSSLLSRRLEGVRTCNVFFPRTCNAPGVMGGGTTCNEFFQKTCNAPDVHLLEGTFGTLQFAIKNTEGGADL